MLTNTLSSFSCVTRLTLVYWIILHAFFSYDTFLGINVYHLTVSSSLAPDLQSVFKKYQ